MVGLVAGERAVLGRYHDVFDAGPETSPQVDTRLHRESVAGDERCRVPGHDVGVLVLLDPDPVSYAVNEALAVPGRGDQLPPGTVDLLTRRADHGGRDRGGLREVQDPEQLEELRFGLSGHHGAGDVRAVPDTVPETEENRRSRTRRPRPCR